MPIAYAACTAYFRMWLCPLLLPLSMLPTLSKYRHYRRPAASFLVHCSAATAVPPLAPAIGTDPLVMILLLPAR